MKEGGDVGGTKVCTTIQGEVKVCYSKKNCILRSSESFGGVSDVATTAPDASEKISFRKEMWSR